MVVEKEREQIEVEGVVKQPRKKVKEEIEDNY
jgi:hypothetical protein